MIGFLQHVNLKTFWMSSFTTTRLFVSCVPDLVEIKLQDMYVHMCVHFTPFIRKNYLFIQNLCLELNTEYAWVLDNIYCHVACVAFKFSFISYIFFLPDNRIVKRRGRHQSWKLETINVWRIYLIGWMRR